MKDEQWTMKDGKEIAVSDMSEEHVKNILRMLIRLQRERELYDNVGFTSATPEYWKD